MKRHANAAIVSLAVITCAGAATALVIASSAAAWDWTNLPNGYSVSGSSYQQADGSSCHIVKVDGHLMGDDCVDAAGLYAAVNAYVDSTICTVNPAAGGDACITTTTSTTATTTAAAATTSSTQTTTSAAPAAPTAADPVATTPAATATTSATMPSVDDQIAQLTSRISQLEQQIAALSARVDRIALAGDASWLAFEQAVAGGADAATAAGIARGTFLNAEYGLGQFAAP